MTIEKRWLPEGYDIRVVILDGFPKSEMQKGRLGSSEHHKETTEKDVCNEGSVPYLVSLLGQSRSRL